MCGTCARVCVCVLRRTNVCGVLENMDKSARVWAYILNDFRALLYIDRHTQTTNSNHITQGRTFINGADC